MNDTTNRETQLRSLTRRIAHAREAAARQTIEREAAIRRHGVAHPRSIEVTDRLHRTQSDYRSLLRIYVVSASEHRRILGHQRV